ncbi:metal ABC transporter ATP-binding protein [Alloyangia pacifica]|uniref:Zinc transport system ATP-binding protein n=1 Tax=Alloyangia pacifica TaxID=311180 RepID=A0A1I6TF45_9RHOB|nr:metal ABC transporter ATP-binding protein [Alloyangia pacifica]SDH20454.1 zinc transport system ATP-binding protein [Alloyangia pacifica]SFS87766.1 zinc transport system ATP-binding protein [Alloyangia pacifica]
MKLIEAQGLRVSLGEHPVLQGVDFHVDPGEIVTIVGPNGSGKSTLLRTLIGAVKPQAGKVTRKPGLRLGYVPQKLQIDATLPLTVARFLSLPHRISRAEGRAALEEAGAGALEGRPMSGLSGGQFQRVLLARAILGKPEVLLLDEPTQGLDQPGSAAFYRQIEQIRARLGCAVVMVSHELHVVMSASDRVVCLNGHVCCQGHPETVAQAAEYRALFGTGTHGALALYRHEHTHTHDHAHERGHDHAHDHHHDHAGHGH